MPRGKTTGFTIVELLIVIVVIAILAAITIVAYNGIQNRANDTSVQSDLRQVAAKFHEYKILNGVIPTSGAELTASGAKSSRTPYGNHYTPASSNGYNLLFCYTSAAADDWGLVAASKSGTVFVFKGGGVSTGVGPLVSWTTTCSNNGLPAGGQWLFNNGTWMI